jgi:hypothetical protein
MRIVCCLAVVAGLLAQGTAATAGSDAIPHGDGGMLTLGAGWGPYERFNGTSFRWVANDAEIALRPGTGETSVTIACEGGPSLRTLVFPLRVLDPSRRQVDHIVCAGAAHPVQMLLPLAPGGTRYVLHADGGGKRIATVGRTLNFRVFSLSDDRVEPAGAVIDPRSGIRLGSGWYRAERFGGENFRWMQRAGHLVVSSRTGGPATLRLQLEVGPSVGSPGTQVAVGDTQGKTLYHGTLQGRGVLAVPVQLHPGDNEFVLSVRSLERPVARDPRRLDLRIFGASLAH